ncbi:MAG TPA: division/cell wall cluster transcriptional repressor MraZ [Polyangiaceae bacterium]|nr:division/cell wall cluster transcriptional repressor MraZ [Polyangiaceae bacterium]
MFRGQFQHTIDGKGRVSLPSRFREALLAEGDLRLVMTPAPFDPCLHVFPYRAWEEFERKIADLPSLDPRIVRFRRLYVSPAIELELDRAGRVLLPPSFRDKAQLTRDVLWAGMGRTLEVWAKERWDQATAMSAAEMAEFKASVQELIKV